MSNSLPDERSKKRSRESLTSTEVKHGVSNHSKGIDKRDYFRVNKDVVFDFRTVDAQAAESDDACDAFESSANLSLLNKLKRIDRDSVKSLQLLTEKNRLLEDYLQTMSQKIDLIAQHILFHEESDEKTSVESPNIEKNRTRINLSEDGIAFVSPRTLYKDSFIAVRLVFLPSYTVVTSFAKILRCSPKDKHHQAAAQFYRLNETDRQEISREILKAQVQYKRSGVAL